MHRIAISLAAIATIFTASACGSGGMGSLAAAESIAAALCTKLQECNSAAFDFAYDSQQACIDVGTGSLTNDTVSPCDEAEVATCVSDTSALECADIDFSDESTYTPSSCSGC